MYHSNKTYLDFLVLENQLVFAKIANLPRLLETCKICDGFSRCLLFYLISFCIGFFLPSTVPNILPNTDFAISFEGFLEE